MRMYLLEKVIPSKTQRIYLKEVGHQFTDREIASLIYNSHNLKWPEKVAGLSELSECTQDVILQKEIAERFVRNGAQQKDFEQSRPDEIIELLYIHEDDVREYLEEDDIDMDKYYFRTVEDAKLFAKKRLPNNRYRLLKYRVLDANGTLRDTFADAFEYYPDSELARPFFSEDEREYRDGAGLWKECEERFEWYKVKYPMPFKDGDIVRYVESDRCGILKVKEDDGRLLVNVIYRDSIWSVSTGPFDPLYYEIITNIQEVDNYEFLYEVWKETKKCEEKD